MAGDKASTALAEQEKAVDEAGLKNANPAADQKALTAEEKAAAEKRYAEKVVYFVKREEGVVRDVLAMHWERGQFALDLLQDPRKYGSKTAEQFGHDISPNRENPYPADTVRKWVRFYQRYTQDQLEEAIKQRISWRAIEVLSALDDLKRRADLQKKISDGKISVDDLRAMVKKTNAVVRESAKKSGKKGAEMRGGESPGTAMKNCILLGDEFSKKLDNCKNAIKEHDKMDDENPRKKETTQRRKELVKMLDTVMRKMEALRESAAAQ